MLITPLVVDLFTSIKRVATNEATLEICIFYLIIITR